jgi:hypothetical protein
MKYFFVVMVLCLTVLASCGSLPVSPMPSPTSSIQTTPDPYPYPAPPATGAYPPAEPRQGPPFTIDGPVTAAEGLVRGSGPAGVPIRIVNITRGAEEIATVTIGDDGRFSATIAGKVSSGDRIGIMLGDVRGTRFNREDFLSGPGYQDIPFIGIIFTSILVE